MTAVGKLGDAARPVGGRGRLGHPQGRHREHGGGRARPSRREGQGPARATRWSASAAPGPAHAAGVARMLGVREVIIPPASGAASALGFLVAPLSLRARALASGAHRAGLRRRGDQRHPGRAGGRRPRAARRGRHRRRAGDGRALAPTCASSARCTRSTCRCRPARSATASLGAIRAAFADVYTARYTSLYGEAAHRGDQLPRARASGPTPELSLDQAGGAAAPQKRKGARQAWFGDGFVEAAVYDRYALVPGDTHRRPRHRRGARGDHHRAARRQPRGRRQSQPAPRDRRRGAAAGAGRARHAARRRDGAHRGRSDLARDHVEPPRHRRRGDVAHRLPHGLLADHLGSAGFRLRAARRQGRAAGAFAARDAGVQSLPAARREGAAGEISRPRRWCRATCWSPTIRGSAPAICSTSRS